MNLLVTFWTLLANYVADVEYGGLQAQEQAAREAT